MEDNLYIFKAKCINIVDGDTIDCEIDLGFNLKSTQRVRLHGINTYELRSKDILEKARAFEARDLLRILILDKDIYIQTYKADSFGRYLAKVYIDDLLINDTLLNQKLAVPFMTNTSIY